MRCRVRCLRKRGQRIDWKIIDNLQAVVGNLGTHYVEIKQRPYFIAEVRDPNQSAKRALLKLFEPVLIKVAPNNMVLRGFENGGFVQEWIIEPIT